MSVVEILCHDISKLKFEPRSFGYSCKVKVRYLSVANLLKLAILFTRLVQVEDSIFSRTRSKECGCRVYYIYLTHSSLNTANWLLCWCGGGRSYSSCSSLLSFSAVLALLALLGVLLALLGVLGVLGLLEVFALLVLLVDSASSS